MAETEGGDVNRQAFQVAYDSADSANAPGPALVAFGRLIREANAQINGKKSTVKVLVQSDFEHKCFNITFDVVQSVLRQIATFLTGDEVKNAKEILEDLGIILGTPGLGLFGYLQWKKKRRVAEVRDSDIKGIVIVQLGDGNTATVSRNAVELSKNAKIRTAVENTLKPLGVDGIETIKFLGDTISAKYSKDEATSIVASFDVPADATADIPEESDDEGVIAWLRVYAPVFSADAPKWRFIYDGKPISADITETTIAADTLQRGAASVNDLYKVRLRISSHITPTGQENFEYKILEVIDFSPSTPQLSLSLDPPQTP